LSKSVEMQLVARPQLSRRAFAFRFASAALLAVSLVGAVGGVVWAASSGETAGETGAKIELRDELKRGLKAKRPADEEYLDHVADLVEDGTLPRSLVDSTFDWARHKREPRVPYFRKALSVRAQRLGISI
jgi:hypothetical protein